jgi:16S rRNA (cytosine1407-C5)-methyltransferase
MNTDRDENLLPYAVTVSKPLSTLSENQHTPLSRTFRLNCRPREIARVESLLQAEGFVFEDDPCHPLARRLTSGPTGLGNSLAHRFGYIYIQDRSSMLPPLALDPPEGSCVLDLCASPGSKTSMLARMVGPRGLVLANEVNPSRLTTLRANLRLLNLPNVVTTCYQAQELPLAPASWDFILVDAPCSGWGTREKNPRVMQVWTPDKLAPLLRIQREILDRAAELLAPGGTLVYSTCTTNPQENQDQIRYATSRLGLVPAHLPRPEGFTVLRDGDPLLTDTLLVDGEESQGQGFFVARLTKPETRDKARDPERVALKGEPVAMDALTSTHPLRQQALAHGTCRVFRDKVFFLHEKIASHLTGELRWQGFALGSLRKNRFHVDPLLHCLMPDHGILGGMDVAEIDILHKMISGQSLPAPDTGTHGGLYWQGLPLGWLKYKGKRCLWSDR